MNVGILGSGAVAKTLGAGFQRTEWTHACTLLH